MSRWAQGFAYGWLFGWTTFALTLAIMSGMTR